MTLTHTDDAVSDNGSEIMILTDTPNPNGPQTDNPTTQPPTNDHHHDRHATLKTHDTHEGCEMAGGQAKTPPGGGKRARAKAGENGGLQAPAALCVEGNDIQQRQTTPHNKDDEQMAQYAHIEYALHAQILKYTLLACR